MLAILCQSMQQVCMGRFCVIAPLCNTAPFEEILQGWRAAGNIVSDLTSPRFEPQTFRFRDRHHWKYGM